MYRATFVLACCFSLSACTGVTDIFSSTASKINKAFPVSSEVRVARENLLSLFEKDQEALESFNTDYELRLELRGLTCAQSLSIGRFTSVDEVRSMPVSRDCLNEQDGKLMELVGLRLVGARSTQPALRPLQPLGRPRPVPRSADLDVYSGTTASNAGIAVLHGTAGEAVAIEIPGGNKIATLTNAKLESSKASLSPNGRILAAPGMHKGMFFFDTETGNKLFETNDIREVLAWLPDISAAVVVSGKDSSLALIDFKTGKLSPHPVPLDNQKWALVMSGSPSRVLVGDQNSFSDISHTRGDAGIQAKVNREFRIKDGHGVTSMDPLLMLDGKAIVFASMRNLKMFNLETGKETLWDSEDVLTIQYAKLDENRLLVSAVGRAGSNVAPWVFDITKATVAPVQEEMESSGIVYAAAGRNGFMRRGAVMWFGDEVRTGTPMTLEAAVASTRMQRQLAQLEAESQYAAVDTSSSPAMTNGYAERLATLRRLQMMEMAAASGAPRAAGTSSSGPLADLARDAQVEAVGVYEGSSSPASQAGQRMRDVEVKIRRSAKPVLLVLSSYEPVRWILKQEPGARLAAVLVSGYHQSEVRGAGSTRVVMSGTSYAYQPDSEGYHQLNRDVKRLTGKTIYMFQGRYEGKSFSVGG